MLLSATRLRTCISQVEHIFRRSRVSSLCATSYSCKTFPLKDRHSSCPFHTYHMFNSSQFINNGVSSSLLASMGIAALTGPKCRPSFKALCPSDVTYVNSLHTSAPGRDKGGGNEVKKGVGAQFKSMFKDYWYVLVPVHCATSIVWYGGFYLMCKSGIDMVGFLEYMGASEKILSPLRNSDAGYYALAYACYKIATPFRYTVTVGGTGYSIKYLNQKGILKAKDVTETAREKASDLKETSLEKISDLKENYEEAMEKLDFRKEKAKERLSDFKNKLTIKYKNK